MPLLQRKRYLNLNHAGVYAPAPAGDSAAYTNFVARSTSLDAGHLAAYKDLLDGLTTDGFFDGSGNSSVFDALYILATQDTTNAVLNLVSSSFTLSPTGAGLTFTTDRGYVSAGAHQLGTGFNPSSASSPKYVQNSAHMSLWCNTNQTHASVAMGVNTNNCIYPKFTDNSMYGRVNDASGSTGTAISDPRGLLVANRSASGAIQRYQNGSSFGTGTQASTTVPNGNINILGGSSAGGTSTYQISAASIGASMDATQNTNFYNRLRTYMTAVGVP